MWKWGAERTGAEADVPAILDALELCPGGLSEQVSVPILSRLREREAERELSRRGLQLGTVTWQQVARAIAEPGTVIESTPARGDLARVGTAVDLVFAALLRN